MNAMSLLSEAEEAVLAELMAGPLVGVHVRIAVKLRAMQHDFGSVTVIDHSFQWPIPAVFAAANTHPVALNTHGIQLDVTLSKPETAAPAQSVTEQPIQPITEAPTQPIAPAPPQAVPVATQSDDPAADDTTRPVGGDVLGRAI